MNMITTIKRNEFSKAGDRYEYLCKRYKPGNILDIGNVGGIGTDQRHNSSSYFKFLEYAKDSTVYGFDLYEPEVGAELYKNQKYGNIDSGLPYEDSFFDTVYMGEILEHLLNFATALSEVHRVLKPDGRLILDTPNAYSIGRGIRYLCGWESIGNPTHSVLFTPASLKAMLLLNKFEIVDIADDKPDRLSKLLNGVGEHLLITARPI